MGMNQQIDLNDPVEASDFASRSVRPRHFSAGTDRWSPVQPGPRRLAGRADQVSARSGANNRREDRDHGCCTPEDERAWVSA